MPVSSGLQKYFDAQRGKKDDTQARLDAMAAQIDPAFSQSFADFRDKILGIIEENPDESEMIGEELVELTEKLQSSKRIHNLKKAKTIIDTADMV